MIRGNKKGTYRKNRFPKILGKRNAILLKISIIDFLVQTENRIIPIEVKAEVNVKSKSLHGFVVNDHAEEVMRL